MTLTIRRTQSPRTGWPEQPLRQALIIQSLLGDGARVFIPTAKFGNIRKVTQASACLEVVRWMRLRHESDRRVNRPLLRIAAAWIWRPLKGCVIQIHTQAFSGLSDGAKRLFSAIGERERFSKSRSA